MLSQQVNLYNQHQKWQSNREITITSTLIKFKYDSAPKKLLF